METDLGFSIFGHILQDFMEIFQDGGISQLGISLLSSVFGVFQH